MYIFNSLSRKLEKFRPLRKKKVTVYVCGITPYDTTHLGHAFTYISFDVLIRYLKFLGFKVAYTQNITDINDRDKDILKKAKEQNISWKKLADFWTKKFLQDMKSLNWVFPDNYLKASEQIPSMIKLIEKLLKKRLAYSKTGSVYLDITKIKNYGKLSKLSQKQMLEKALEFEEDIQNPDKKNPLDITLWRAKKEGELTHIPSFPSPFGRGRPGWHIECSAMSIASLGKQLDIHGGGKDLKFPHHEAEIAQSEGATVKKFAKYWLHTGVVYFAGQKMSKSKGNLVMVSNILKKYSPNAIRWLLLSNQWHEDWEYQEKDLTDAQNNVNFIESALAFPDHVREFQKNYIPDFTQIMNNNLNTPDALQFLLKLAKQKQGNLKDLYRILGFKIY